LSVNRTSIMGVSCWLISLTILLTIVSIAIGYLLMKILHEIVKQVILI
jgi:hypothetical protein